MADNDEKPAARFNHVQNAIRDATEYGIPSEPLVVVPPTNQERHIPSIAVLMLPRINETGNIETILFQAGTVKNARLAGCIEQFCDSYGAAQWKIGKLSKFKARIMLSASCKQNPDKSMGGAWESNSGMPFPVTDKRFDDI